MSNKKAALHCEPFLSHKVSYKKAALHCEPFLSHKVSYKKAELIILMVASPDGYTPCPNIGHTSLVQFNSPTGVRHDRGREGGLLPGTQGLTSLPRTQLAVHLMTKTKVYLSTWDPISRTPDD